MGILTFRLARQRFAVPLGSVVEVVRAVAVTPLSQAAPIVDGVIDFRGTLIPVLDLGQRFGLPPRPVAPDQRFVIVRDPARLVGLRVDATEWLADLPDGALRPTEGLIQGEGPVSGAASLEDGIVLIHDVGRFLTAAEAHSLEAARR